MYKPVYLALLIAVTYYGCQKGIEDPSLPGTIEAHQWRLSGYLFDTTKYGNLDIIDYSPEYFYDDYYCISTPADPPLNGATYLSPYKCTVVMGDVYYGSLTLFAT